MSIFKRNQKTEAPVEPQKVSIRSINGVMTIYLALNSIPDHLLEKFWDECQHISFDPYSIRQFERDFMAAHGEEVAQ